MTINLQQTIERLEAMSRDNARMQEFYRSKKRMRPSEKAATLASYIMEKEAIDFAIAKLKGEK